MSVFIIAEAGVNHNLNVKLTKKLEIDVDTHKELLNYSKEKILGYSYE